MVQLLLYNVFLKAYYWGIKLAAINNVKAEKWIKGRADIFSEAEQALNNTAITAKRIWLHASSLGEFEQGRPLIELIKKHHPDYLFIITFFSPSGYEVRKNYEHAGFVFYLPLDGKQNAEKFISIIKPDLAIFVKYEYWYYYFAALKKQQVPLIILSAIFRGEQPFFKWYGQLHRRILRCADYFFVQDKNSVQLLSGLNLHNVTQIPDTRIDRVWQVVENAVPVKIVEEFLAGSKAFLGGSIYAEENNLLLNAYNKGILKGKIILAPHKVDVASVTELLKPWGEQAVRLSAIDDEIPEGKNVLFIDAVGLLNNLYQYAYMAVIGGGFGKSIHNILEPAAFGIPVLFGPNHYKFKEANELIKSGGGFEINRQNFNDIVNRLQSDANFYEQSAKASRRFIQSNTGGTEKVYRWLREKKLL